MTIYKFTPDLTEPALLDQLSVGRETISKDIIKRLEQHAAQKMPLYVIFIGPRGIGKSHLLLSIYYKIRNDTKLSDKLLPIKLSEEEYSIASITDLFQRILDEVNGQTSKRNRIRATSNEGVIVEETIAALDRIAKGKMPIIFIDNLHLIFGQFPQKDLKKLRSVLQERNNISIIGASTSIFNHISDYGKPFYNFFELVFLAEWNQNQIEEFIKRKLELEGKKDLLRDFPKLEQKIRAITILTGGNPRLVLSLCEILCAPEKMTDIEETLLTILDQLTPFYQARMEELPTQQRKIFDILSISDGPITPTEIARISGYNINAVNVQLKRLEQMGFVETIKLRRKKAVNYEVKERLFRIWREMRLPLGRLRIRLFVNFLRLWYSKSELQKEHSLLLNVLRKEETNNQNYLRNLIHNMHYIQDAVGGTTKYRLLMQRFIALIRTKKFDAAEDEILNVKECINAKTDDYPNGFLELLESMLFIEKGDFEKSIETARRALELNPTNFSATYPLALSLDQLDRFEELEKCANIMISYNDQYTKVEGMYSKAKALWMTNRSNEALSTIDQALNMNPTSFQKIELGLTKADVLFELKKYDETASCLDQLSAESGSKKIAKQIAFRKCWVNLLLKKLTIAEQCIDRYARINPSAVDDILLLKSLLLTQKQEFEEALRVLSDGIQLSTVSKEKRELFTNTFLTITKKAAQRSIIDGNEEKATLMITDALKLTSKIHAQFISDFLLEFFRFLLQQKKNNYIINVFDSLNKSSNDIETEQLQILIPIVKASEYIVTNNVDILEGLQKEIRQMVITIVKQYSPETSIPKQIT